MSIGKPGMEGRQPDFRAIAHEQEDECEIEQAGIESGGLLQ